MRRNGILPGFGKLTGLFFLVAVLFRVLSAFNVRVEGQVYADSLFLIFLVATVFGYALRHSEFLREVKYARLVLALSLISVGLIVASILPLPFPIFLTKSVVFWTGIAAAGLAVIITSVKLEDVIGDGFWGERDEIPHRSWKWKRWNEEFGECAVDPKDLPKPELLDPKTNRDGRLEIRGYGVEGKAQRESIVFPFGGGSGVAIAGSGRLRCAGGLFGFDGLLLINSTCPVSLEGLGDEEPTDKDVLELDLGGMEEIRSVISKEMEEQSRRAASIVREVTEKRLGPTPPPTPPFWGIRVYEGEDEKRVRLPGIDVIERPGKKHVRIAGFEVLKEEGEEGQMFAYGTIEKDSKPVTVVESTGAVRRTILIGNRWVVVKKENGRS